MSKPNFFLIGAPKSGTTSLYHYLSEHHEIFSPEIKEQHLFSQPEVRDTYYDVFIVNNMDEYLKNYEGADKQKIVADFSSSYLYNIESANRIKEFDHNAKVIAILRDPVDRALSHYLMDLRIGYVNKPFKEYIQDVNSMHYKEYIANGFYYEKIKYYKDVFADNFLVLSFDDLKQSPQKVLDKVFSFLEIEQIEVDFAKKYNTYAQPNSSLFYYLRKLGLYNLVKFILPSFIKNLFNPLLEDNTKEKPNFHDEKEMLNKVYKDENLNLERLLGRKFW